MVKSLAAICLRSWRVSLSGGGVLAGLTNLARFLARAARVSLLADLLVSGNVSIFTAAGKIFVGGLPRRSRLEEAQLEVLEKNERTGVTQLENVGKDRLPLPSDVSALADLHDNEPSQHGAPKTPTRRITHSHGHGEEEAE
jgi:hypothetical protein